MKRSSTWISYLMPRSLIGLSRLATSCFCMLLVALSGSAPCHSDSLEALESNAEMLHRIRSIYVAVSVYGYDEGSPQEKKLSLASESWRKNVLERDRVHLYQIFGEQGGQVIAHGGIVNHTAWNRDTTLRLNGWDDRKNVPATGADPQVHPIFHTKGGIYMKDPVRGTSDNWTRLLMQLVPGQTAKDVALAGSYSSFKASLGGCVAVKIESVNDDRTKHLNGVICEFDPDEDFALRKVRWPNGLQNTAVDFQRYAADRISIPTRVDCDLVRDGKIMPLSQIVVTSIAVNEDIRDDQLTIEFPENTRVDDLRMGTPLIHVWGNGEPKETFTNMAEFSNYVRSSMPDALESTQRVVSEDVVLSKTNTTTIFIVANLVLVVILAVLIWLRHKAASGSARGMT